MSNCIICHAFIFVTEGYDNGNAMQLARSPTATRSKRHVSLKISIDTDHAYSQW